MFKVQLPGIPWPVLRYFYGMMAPYQGYSTVNADLLAEGKNPDGTWERIDLDRYYPMIRGNRIMYRRLRSFLSQGEAAHQQKYTELATLLLKREKRRGETYAAVRLTWQEWPVSPLGWDALRREPLIKNYPLTEVP